MMEAPYIIRMNIQHYQDLLKFNRVAAELRSRVTTLLIEAQAHLPLAEAEHQERVPSSYARPTK
jgi:hypothetical protein